MRVVRATLPLEADPLPRAETIERAAELSWQEAIAPVAVARSPRLDALADPAGRVRVHLALENLQVTGSFKVRGALFAMTKKKEEGVARIVAASAGNHGAGVAYAARRLAMKATVVVPKTAPRKKVETIRGYGAEIVEHGDGYDAAEVHAKELATSQGVPFLSPYDDVDVVAGNGGSLAFEIHQAMFPNGRSGGDRIVVVAPIGGGGLATGLACGFAVIEEKAYGAERIVWGAQSEASPAFAMSLEKGAAVETLPFAKTLADGLEGGIAARAFARAKGVLAGAVVVTEEEIAHGLRFAFVELGLVLEGSAAAALVPALTGSAASLRDGTEKVDLVVVLTGRNVDREQLLKITS
jgi:threonine dehydratase